MEVAGDPNMARWKEDIFILTGHDWGGALGSGSANFFEEEDSRKTQTWKENSEVLDAGRGGMGVVAAGDSL